MITTVGDLIEMLRSKATDLPTGMSSPVYFLHNGQEFNGATVTADPNGDDTVVVELAA